MTEDDPLLTPDEVAQELRVEKQTVYRLIRSGELDHLDLGYRCKRVLRSALNRYKANKIKEAIRCK